MSDEDLELDEIAIGDALTDFSPNRLNTLGQCGRKFKYSYVDKVPRGPVGSALVVGSVMHDAIEAWYLGERHGEEDLWPYVRATWELRFSDHDHGQSGDSGHDPVWHAILAHEAAEAEAKEFADFIQFKRPTLKSPTGTKEYMESPQAKALGEASAAVIELAQADEHVQWAKDEMPHVAFRKSKEWAETAQATFQPLDAPIAVEMPFVIEVGGYRMQGRIDQVRVDANEHGEAIVSVVDYKSNRQPMSPQSAALQAIIYHEAVKREDALPDPDRVSFYLIRSGLWQPAVVRPERHLALLDEIVADRARRIEQKSYSPSYGYWCDRCDYSSLCAEELGLWEGAGLRESHLS